MFKRFKNHLGEFATNPFVLAFAPAIVIVLLLPFSFSKFQVVKIAEKYTSTRQFYHDLDKDGDTEEILLGYDTHQGESGPRIIIFDVPDTQLIIDQVNPDYPFVEKTGPVFTDYDHDSLCEIFVFLKNDSALYIAGVEVNKNNPRQDVFIQKFINHVNYKNKAEDYVISPAPSVDLNGDGFDEVIFLLLGLYSAEPRQFCAFDIVNDTIFRSPGSALAYSRPIHMINNPKNPESKIITCFTTTPSNYKGDRYSLDDSRGWSLALDERLEFIYPPIPHKKGYWFSVESVPFMHDDEAGVISLFKIPYGSDEKEVLRKIDLTGNIIKEVILDESEFHRLIAADNYNYGKFWLHNRNKATLSLINARDFETENEVTIEPAFPLPGEPFMYRNLELVNGSTERVTLVRYPDKVVLYQEDFSDPAEIEGAFDGQEFTVDVIHFDSDPQPVLYMSFGDRKMFYHYLYNPFYILKYPVWSLIYLLSAAFFYFLLKYQRKLLKRKYDAEKQLMDYRLKALKNQADPHFILNTVNNVSAMFSAGRSDEARIYIAKLARLMHQSLMNTEKLISTVRDELNFIKDYLGIQRMRFPHFEYEIRVDDESLWEETIPENVLYSFVENALKHGLRPKQGEGFLQIVVERFGRDKMICRVIDNGIGRKNARKNNSGNNGNTGKGLIINQQILELYNKATGAGAAFKIYDLTHDNGLASGTEVQLITDIISSKFKSGK